MTLTDAEAKVRRLIDQTDSSNTNFSSSFIADHLNAGRRMLAGILHFRLIPNLQAVYTVTSGSPATFASLPTDFLRHEGSLLTLIDSIPALYVEQERWAEYNRMVHINADVTPASATERHFCIQAGNVEVRPNYLSLKFGYIKKPDDLSGAASSQFTPDIDDLVVNYCFMKCAGTEQGDLELAEWLLKTNNIQMRSKR